MPDEHDCEGTNSGSDEECEGSPMTYGGECTEKRPCCRGCDKDKKCEGEDAQTP